MIARLPATGPQMRPGLNPRRHLPGVLLCGFVLGLYHCGGIPSAGAPGGVAPGLGESAENNRDASPADHPSQPGDTSPGRDGAAAERGRPDTRAAADVYYPPVKCSDSLIFCEDFENGALDPARWTTWTKSATATLDSTRPLGGRYALHVRTTGVDSQGYIQTRKTFAVAANNLNIRFFVYMEKVTPSHWFSIAWATDAAAGSQFPLPKHGFLVAAVPYSEVTPGAPSSFETFWDDVLHGFSDARHAVPAERWTCWELEYRGQTALHFYLDDQQIQSVDLALPKANPSYNDFLGFGTAIGQDKFTHPSGFNVWIDDIAVSDRRIGCTR